MLKPTTMELDTVAKRLRFERINAALQRAPVDPLQRPRMTEDRRREIVELIHDLGSDTPGSGNDPTVIALCDLLFETELLEARLASVLDPDRARTRAIELVAAGQETACCCAAGDPEDVLDNHLAGGSRADLELLSEQRREREKAARTAADAARAARQVARGEVVLTGDELLLRGWERPVPLPKPEGADAFLPKGPPAKPVVACGRMGPWIAGTAGVCVRDQNHRGKCSWEG